MLKLSIIIPTLNRSGDLEKTLECLLVQESKGFQILLVDQSDDDRSEFVSNAYKNKGLNLNYYKFMVKSLTQARNYAIDKIDYLDNLDGNKTDVIVFLDDDVSFESDFLLNLHLYISSKPNVIGGTWKIHSPSRTLGFTKKLGIFLLGGGRGTNQQIVTKCGFNQMFNDQPEVEQIVQWTSGCGMWYRRSVFEAGYRFPRHFLRYSIMEDLFFSYRIFLDNKNCLTYTPSVEMTHHESPNRTIPNYQKIRQHCVHRYIFHKMFGISMVGYLWNMLLLMCLDLITFRNVLILKEYYKSLVYVYKNKKNLNLDNGEYNDFIFDL